MTTMNHKAHCPNCERLEDEILKLSGCPKCGVDRRYDLHDKIVEIDKLKKQLEMFTEDNVRKVILEWKHTWMNQHANSQEDHENYFRRAFGIDANMQYDLARKIAAMAKLDGAE